jgi:hypothetical protein
MCLVEVRHVVAGAVYPRCNEKREPAKRAGRGGPLWSQGPSMTCDLGRRVSRPPLVEGLCFFICHPRSGDSEDTSLGHCTDNELGVAGTWTTPRY